jgi:nitrite reductase (NADH) large subunit
VIIGAGIAGVSAAETIRKKTSKPSITLLSNDPIEPYYRLNLTRYLAGETEENDLPLKPKGWYEQNSIKLELNSEAAEIDRKEKLVKLKNGKTRKYSKLIITSGSHAFMPPFPGSNKKNVIMLRHKQNADAILKTCEKGAKCVCVGGGILGLETAAALAKRNLDVTVIEGYGWLLPRQLNKSAGNILETYASNMGIKFIKSAIIKEFIGDENAGEVLLEDGTSIRGDIFIIATGVRSNTYLARKAGLEVNKGIIVDDHMKTSDDEIWAAGDASEHRGINYGTWGPAQFQGEIAALNSIGMNAEFHGIPRSNILKVMGVDLFSIGQIQSEDASCIQIEENKNNNYYCFFLKDNYLIGTILIGDTSISAKVKNAIEEKTDFSEAMKYDRSLEKILTILNPNK